MDQKFKSDWLQALRGGQYQQCRNELTDGLGFCCIGVGYEVAGHACEEISNEDDPTRIAAEEIGIRPEVLDQLIKMNDGTASEPGLSFAEIADFIEKTL